MTVRIQSVAYVSLRELLPEGDDFKDICSLISPEFTWGDTDLALVSRDRFLDALRYRSAVSSLQIRKDLMETISFLPRGIYISLD